MSEPHVIKTADWRVEVRGPLQDWRFDAPHYRYDVANRHTTQRRTFYLPTYAPLDDIAETVRAVMEDTRPCAAS